MSSIIITGDSSGVGYEIATRVLRETDYSVVGISRSGSDIAAEFPDRYTHVEFDLSNPDGIQALYTDTLKSHSPIRGLVNNAALAYDDIITNAEIDTLTKMFAVNVISPIILTKYCIRDMLLYGTRGSIVHVSSVCSKTGYTGLAMYGATKGALEAFSLSCAREWGRKDIRSNCVAPGFINTSMTDSLSEEQRERIYNRTSLGEATDLGCVADTVLFLLSEEATSITGEVVRIDAGT